MDMPMGNLSSGQKDELMDQVRQQIAVANAQELLTVRFALAQPFHCRRFGVSQKLEKQSPT